MNLFKRLGLSRQIILLLLVCVVGILLVAAVYHTTLGEVSSRLAAAAEQSVTDSKRAAEITNATLQAQNTLQNLIREKDLDALEAALNGYKTRRATMDQVIRDLGESEVSAAAAAWTKSSNQIVDLILVVNTAEANSKFITELMPLQEKLFAAVDNTTAKMRERVRADVASATAHALKTRRTLVISIIAGGTIFSIVGFMLAIRIAKPLKQAVGELNGGAEQVSDAATQVSSAAQQAAANATQQAASVESTVNTLSSFAKLLTETAQSANMANDLAQNARSGANASGQTMATLDESITAINASAEQMRKIIRVIEEIAFQTNLLALNAAVEAARAGEHGKGFAVVAEEVRNLAMRSAEAAQNTVKLIGESTQRAKDGVEVCAKVRNELTTISSQVNSVADLIQQISGASAQQTQQVDNLRESVKVIDELTNKNASVAEEAAAASEQLTAMARTLRSEVVEELSILAMGSRKARLAA